MRSRTRYVLRQILLLTTLVAFMSGCTTVPRAVRTSVQLTTINAIVTLLRTGTESRVLVEKQIPVEIQQNDRIDLDVGGRARLQFPDHIVVELFRETAVEVLAVHADPSASIFLQLKLEHGTAKAEVVEGPHARVEISTEYAVLRTVGPNTDFVACHTPRLTCVVAREGEMEVEAAGRIVTLKGGESSYIFPGEPPTPPICADLDQIDEWLDLKRSTDPVEGLGAIVAGWPQSSCSQPADAPILATSPEPETVECPTFNLINPKDGARYVHVPGGEFTMGADEATSVSQLEQPQHTAIVENFWIQCTEVTNAQYGRCVAEGACTPPTADRWDAQERASHPVTHVNWQQANEYARWAGGRLPTEAEWEKACRSTDARTYAWGNDPPTADLAVYGGAVVESAPVGGRPLGAGPFGALDMSGNVWEWTTSLERPYPYRAEDGREDLNAAGKRIARGGSFYFTEYQITCTARASLAPTTASEFYGFRVVLTP